MKLTFLVFKKGCTSLNQVVKFLANRYDTIKNTVFIGSADSITTLLSLVDDVSWCYDEYMYCIIDNKAKKILISGMLSLDFDADELLPYFAEFNTP